MHVRRELAESFAPRIPPPARLLDLGCGNGAFLAEAARFGYAATGVDVSHEAVRLTRARGLEAFVGGLDAVAPRRFEYVTMWDVIEHVPAPGQLVGEAFERLESGGFLVVKTPMPGHVTWLVACAVPRAQNGLLGTPEHVQFFTELSLERVLREAGFATIDSKRISAIRGRATGGSLPRRVRRQIRTLIQQVGGSTNAYVFAQRP